MNRLLSLLGAWFLKALYASLRVRHVRQGKIDGTPQYVMAFWHCQVLMMLHARYRRPLSALVSQSRDGELIAQAFQYYGVNSSRGSSTRGAVGGLRDMVRRAREGHNLAITPDGPKGPPRIAKDGVVLAAQATGLPILPVAFAAKKKSFCGRGIAWSSLCRRRARSTSMVIRSRFPAAATSRSGECAWSRC